jgi:hypothetical protein
MLDERVGQIVTADGPDVVGRNSGYGAQVTVLSDRRGRDLLPPVTIPVLDQGRAVELACSGAADGPDVVG